MSPLVSKVARNLKALRMEKKLSQAAVARRARFSVSYVSMLERGERSPPLETLETMGKVFGVPPTRFLS